MVVRESQQGEAPGHLCIPQQQHAGLSGQLARAWGNEGFPAPEPWPEICLAAERHDDGMQAFDADPDRDPDTGLPRGFMRMPLDTWLECWSQGPRVVGEDSPYAGILVSMHGEHLLGYRRLEDEPQEAREAAQRWREEQAELREGLARRAAEDARLAEALDAETLESGRRLISTWDAMSLALCMPRLPASFDGIPCERSEREVAMRETGMPGGRLMIAVDPWPFSASQVPLVAGGRRLSGPLAEDEDPGEALRSAPHEQLSFTLVQRKDEEDAQRDGGGGAPPEMPV